MGLYYYKYLLWWMTYLVIGKWERKNTLTGKEIFRCVVSSEQA